MKIIEIIIQILIIIFLSPLISGIITKVKNLIRLRRGQSVLQPYFNLIKYFNKEENISNNASWIFRITPYIVFASVITAAVLVPTFYSLNYSQYLGDFLAVFFILALGRFFMALAGMDPATTFGGMGASREMFISSFVEPVAILSVFAVALACKTTNLVSISQINIFFNISSILAVIAFFLITLVETSRIPVDNQETHLELTMIHEAMLLEYSGRSLALMELSAYIRQMIFFSIIAMIILPTFILQPILYILSLFLISIIVAIVETTIAKMRLFRVVDFIAFAGILSILSVIATVLGV